MLGVFFGNGTGDEIEWFESMVLLLMYLGYVLVMVFNQKIRRALENCCGKVRRMSLKRSSKVDPAVEAEEGAATAAVEADALEPPK